MKEIKLTQGKVALVDDADFDWLNKYKWCAHCPGKTFYAVRHIRRSDGTRPLVGMHQLLAAIVGFSCPDHRDRCGLNNQRNNLRPATKSENNCNQGLSSRNTSGFKGVSWHMGKGCWQATIRKARKTRHLGYFYDPKKAAHAYDVAASRLFGEFAKLNFSISPAEIVR